MMFVVIGIAFTFIVILIVKINKSMKRRRIERLKREKLERERLEMIRRRRILEANIKNAAITFWNK
jgi:hypothetical protein